MLRLTYFMLVLIQVRKKTSLNPARTDNRVAGGEFAQGNLPGAFGVDYQFIDATAIDFFLDAGVNAIRLPFLLVRAHRNLPFGSQ
jgi:hypothetical protein